MTLPSPPTPQASNTEDCSCEKCGAPEALGYRTLRDSWGQLQVQGRFHFLFIHLELTLREYYHVSKLKMHMLDKAHNNQTVLPTRPFLCVCFFITQNAPTDATTAAIAIKHFSIYRVYCFPDVPSNINSFQQSGLQQALQVIPLHTEENVSVCWERGPTSEFLISWVCDGGLRICFSNKFPDDALRLVWNHFENLM